MAEMTDAEVFGTAAPRMGTRDKVIAAARRHGVPEDLALEVAQKESRFNQNARSPKGAMGVMQLMPGTASDLGVDPNDEDQNIDGGVRYIKQQLKTFGGDRRLAMAAYNAGPGNVRKYGGVPPFAETQKYVGGDMAREMSDAEVFGTAKPAPASGQPGAAPMPQRPAAVAPAPAAAPDPNRPSDEWLGFKDRYLKTADKIAQFSPLNMIPGYREGLAASRPKIEASIAQQSQTKKPGMFGGFMGDVAATAWMPGGPVKALAPVVQGGLAGAVLSDATDAGGVARDAALGGVTGGVAKYGFDKLGGVVSTALSKAPQIMDLPALQAAKKAAYEAVDNSGFTFPKEKVTALVDDLAKTVRSSALSKSAKDDAASIIQYAKTLAKGDLSLSQLEKLRGDIYEAMVKKGGDTSVVGTKFRAAIDDLIDTADNNLVRTARDLNGRWKKADLVSRKSKSADIRAEKDYGGDYGRKMKDRVFPLIDPDAPKSNLRGATSDEKAALQRIATGTKSQNLASTVGGMLDPRRLGGKILAGITTTGGGAAAGPTAGMSLLAPALQMGSGFALTGYASRVAQKNVEELLKLIAVGGSKEALKRAPTAASRTVAKATAAAAPLVAAPAAAFARPPQKKPAR